MSTTVRLGPIVGLLGSTLFMIAVLVTGIAYVGTAGEMFSPLNHWISELGERGVSALAIVFNVGLMVGGIALAVFFSALGALRQSKLAWLYVPIGIGAGISAMFVGVFPMNEIGVHRIAALSFFNLGWIAVGLASLDLWRRSDSRFASWLPALGALTVVVFLIFLALYVPSLTYTGTDETRPQISLVVVFEWLVLVGIISWVFAASLSWWRAERGSR